MAALKFGGESKWEYGPRWDAGRPLGKPALLPGYAVGQMPCCQLEQSAGEPHAAASRFGLLRGRPCCR